MDNVSRIYTQLHTVCISHYTSDLFNVYIGPYSLHSKHMWDLPYYSESSILHSTYTGPSTPNNNVERPISKNIDKTLNIALIVQ